jgi:hypothetical protein
MSQNKTRGTNDTNGASIPKKRLKPNIEPTIGVKTLSEEEKERILKLIENEPEVLKLFFNFEYNSLKILSFLIRLKNLTSKHLRS